MSIVVITPPATEPVSVAEAKAHLRIEHDAEDAVIARTIAAAREIVEAYTGLALVTRTMRERKAWSSLQDGALALSWAPLVLLRAVRIDQGALGVSDQALSSVRILAETRPTRLRFLASPPQGVIEVDYDVGFGVAGASSPAALREAVLVVTAALMDNRASPGRAVTDAAVALMAPFMEARL